MTVAASTLFDFLASRPALAIVRHEIASAAFGDLRHSLRLMIVGLSEGDDREAKEIADRLRSVISEWLTVPVRFDNDAVLRVLKEMGEPSSIEARWGRDIRGHHENASRSTETLRALRNPVRDDLSQRFQTLRAQQRSFRIFCHRRSREHFDSIPGEFGIAVLPEEAFIHSVAQYRETEPFDVLVKVGPLRSHGWGSAPDALLTAPRFDTLIQIVWSGCGDEPGFGYDPAAQLTSEGDNQGEGSVAERYTRSLHLKWAVTETRSHDSSVSAQGAAPDVNDLEVFTRLAKPCEVQTATLVQVDDAHGILYPRHSRILSINGDPQSIGYRLAGETLQEGMYLILPIVDDVHLAGLHVEEGRFSQKWKERLRSEYDRDADALVNRLWDSGLELLELHQRIEHWCKAASTVIHAPQQQRHFEILIKVLGLDFDASQQVHRSQPAWWRFAWDEIRRARGEAIQTGCQEQQIIDEQLLVALRTLDTETRANLGQQKFQLRIPPTGGPRGVFRFYRVLGVELGFEAPPGELKILHELTRIDQWRA